MVTSDTELIIVKLRCFAYYQTKNCFYLGYLLISMIRLPKFCFTLCQIVDRVKGLIESFDVYFYANAANTSVRFPTRQQKYGPATITWLSITCIYQASPQIASRYFVCNKSKFDVAFESLRKIGELFVKWNFHPKFNTIFKIRPQYPQWCRESDFHILSILRGRKQIVESLRNIQPDMIAFMS